LTAHRPYTEGPAYGNPFQDHEVPDDQEENPGAGIRINGDTEAAANENDLIEVELEVEPFPVPSGVQYFLRRNNSNIRVWDNRQGTGTALLDSGTEAPFTVTVSPMSVWVENPIGGDADFELVAKDSGGNDVCSDKIHFYPFTSVVIALGGEDQDEADPADANHGMFQLAVDLFEQGYDVHMYNEDAVGNNGAGAVYDEVVSAIQNRNVTRVAIYGYSHGGGSTHDLAERLDDNRGTIGTFTISLTAYIDAVAQPFAYQENRRPPGSAYHINYFQVGVGGLDTSVPFYDYGLDGGPIDNPAPGDPSEVNVDAGGQVIDHYDIDEHPPAINAIRNGVLSLQK